MAAKNPIIVFAPGSWTKAETYDPIRAKLKALGYSSEAVPYPSAGAEPPITTLVDDALAVRSVIEGLCEKGSYVVLVVHSYGGFVGANAVEGLGARQRAERGEKGGVIMVVYMAAFVPPKGKSLADITGGLGTGTRVDGEYVYGDNPEEFYYHDLSPEAKQKAIAEMVHSAKPTFFGPASYEPWHDIPCMYLICEGDQIMKSSTQELLASTLGENTPVHRCSGSHFAYMSVPDEVVEGILKGAKLGLSQHRI